MALYTFQARNKRELSFTKGDILTLYEKLSNDWWEGITNDEREGLVPDKYIKLLNRLATVAVVAATGILICFCFYFVVVEYCADLMMLLLSIFYVT